MWSLDSPDSGRGRAYALVVLDEAALIPNLETAWQESIRPQLTDYQGGAWFLSTPKGTQNYFHTLYQRGQDARQADWASWQMPTSSNPFMPAAEIEAARADLTDLAFAQEYLAQFVSWAGAVFRRILEAIAEAPANVPAAIIGVDWGRTSDYTVFTALAAGGQVLAIDRFRGLEYSLQRGRLQAFHERLGGRAYIIAEYNSMGGPVVEQLQRDGLPVAAFNTTNASKAAAVEALALAFERGSIRIPNDPVLIGELQAFEGKPLPSGLMRYAAPEGGGHDDMVMSLAIGWAALGAMQAQQGHRVLYLDPNTGGYSSVPVPYTISPI
jgi:phage FluMu gp28-like protein